MGLYQNILREELHDITYNTFVPVIFTYLVSYSADSFVVNNKTQFLCLFFFSVRMWKVSLTCLVMSSACCASDL